MSYEFSSTPTSFSDVWAMVSLKFDLGSSPNSPLTSTRFDSDSSLPLTCGQFDHALQEIETTLMAPDTVESITSSAPDPTTSGQKNPPANQTSRTWPPSPRPEKRHKENKEFSSVGEHVKHLLTMCAEALADDRIPDFDSLVAEIRHHVSINGHPIQRLGAYMLEGLVARRQASGSNIYFALSCRRPESKELMSYMRILYDVCPYFKFGYIAANGAIAEAVRNEDQIHIIDFQIAQGTQWVTLVQALAARPGGPPHLRITGIDDPVSEYARGDGLRLVGSMLSDLSKKFSIPIEFNALPVYAPEVTREMLDVRRGEAIVVSLTLVLHHTADESVDVSNPRDGLLRMIKGLSPKVTTLVEQESNTNTASFLMRFAETMEYYSAMFESIDVTLPRESRERINVEQHCLAKDIVNVIACEGKERIERHELLGKWRSRFAMAGVKPYPLSSHVNSVIKVLLGKYSDKYSLMERDGAMLLGWRNRNLISASAWQ